MSTTMRPPFMMSLCMKKGDSSRMLSRRMLCMYLLVRELLLATISNFLPFDRLMVTLSKMGRPTE